MSAHDMDIDTDDGSEDDVVGVEGAGPDGDALQDMESGNLPPLEQPGITTAGRPRQTNKSQTMKLAPRVLAPSEVLFVNHESFTLHF